MSEQELIENDIQAYLVQHQQKELCRFVAVGSVDDGKSTLIGRLLHDTHGVYEDQLSAVRRATKQAGSEIDLSLFTDGLKAEREQGITIDVAYRYFSTAKRKFIIADTPGHIQYTRNMATGASTANVAIILIDARLGVLDQSRRHAYIAALLGIPNLAVCVNKMDLLRFDEAVFSAIQEEFRKFTASLGFLDIKFIPISALQGDNCVHPSAHMPWYQGGTLLEYLEHVPVQSHHNFDDFRFPVQYVQRPNLDYRGFAASVASGVVKKGDRVMVLPSGKQSKVLAIDTFDGEVAAAFPPMSVTLRLEDEIDISRGDILVHPHNLPESEQRLRAMLVWMSETALDKSQTYFLKHTTQLIRAGIEKIDFTVDLESLEQRPANRLELNDIAGVTLNCQKSLYYDPYRKNRATGSFILIDPISNNTVGAGMILGPAQMLAPRDATLYQEARHKPQSRISSDERSERLGQRGVAVWLTGLPCSGKTEIAYALERRLFDQKRFALVVDPDDGLSRNARADGSSPEQMPEFAKRAAEAGVITIFAYASPLRADRAALRDAVGPARFLEVHVSTPLEVCKQRDTRGAYDPNRLDPSYEKPLHPELSVSLAEFDVNEAADRVFELLISKGLLPSRYSL
jgi:bifunctional enzyme CysN/CysC